MVRIRYNIYSASGQLVSMNITSSETSDINGEYYYIRNAQGDIIGLFDGTETQIASYSYDSWGKLISIKDGSGVDITNDTESIGYKNPYRYRGYRYDTETGLYYLQSRYYNPEWGRFINADDYVGTVGDLLSCNMFAYCKNNPVNMSDPDGHNGLLAFTFLDIMADVAEAVVAAVAAPEVLIGVAIVGVGLLAYGGYQYYKNHHMTYSDAETSVSDGDTPEDADVEVVIPRSKYPETAQHVDDAIKSGHPDTLTVDRSKAKSNRKESLKGIPKVKAKDLDEYPPAMFKEGGAGASVRPLNPSDNRGSGSWLGHRLRAFPDGTRVRIRVGD
ncbi:RHS repeat-associated core domain-containing protein [Clostridium taeniosporum]|uniref:RHS repeat-associated core domain-containing protein n=1 Tax=Clostridium taeniosporum TaxID=394958 RepID=UPI000F736995|nr:RHS repeat-associated core domain-containing protein [Clostridium taeniosporum]